jgi:hypothetical protein
MVIQAVEPFMSTEDIPKGAQWLAVLNEKLADTKFCIVCITPENRDAAWLNFEAGAIANAIGEAKVCPILIGLNSTDVQPPMAIFQAAGITETDIWKVVQSVNDQFDQKLAPDQLRRSFERWWPDLEKGIAAALAAQTSQQPVHRDNAELLRETLSEVREQGRLLSQMNSKLFPKQSKLVVSELQTTGSLSVGSTVQHEKWGTGRITAIVGAGRDQLLTINFDEVGSKMLMAKYAPLTLIAAPGGETVRKNSSRKEPSRAEEED